MLPSNNSPDVFLRVDETRIHPYTPEEKQSNQERMINILKWGKSVENPYLSSSCSIAPTFVYNRNEKVKKLLEKL